MTATTGSLPTAPGAETVSAEIAVAVAAVVVAIFAVGPAGAGVEVTGVAIGDGATVAPAMIALCCAALVGSRAGSAGADVTVVVVASPSSEASSIDVSMLAASTVGAMAASGAGVSGAASAGAMAGSEALGVAAGASVVARVGTAEQQLHGADAVGSATTGVSVAGTGADDVSTIAADAAVAIDTVGVAVVGIVVPVVDCCAASSASPSAPAKAVGAPPGAAGTASACTSSVAAEIESITDEHRHCRSGRETGSRGFLPSVAVLACFGCSVHPDGRQAPGGFKGLAATTSKLIDSVEDRTVFGAIGRRRDGW